MSGIVPQPLNVDKNARNGISARAFVMCLWTSDQMRWRNSRLQERVARTSNTNGGPTIVVLQDFGVGLALVCHDCCADLA
jgi:hypothetical protein